MPKASTGPMSTPTGSVPTGPSGGTGLCCTCATGGPVSTNGASKYFSTSGYRLPRTITNKCNLAITRTGSGGTVTITKSFSLAFVNGATSALHDGPVRTAITGAMTKWKSGASRYKVRIEQTGCPPQELRMDFRSNIVTSGADVAVNVDGENPPTKPSAVTGGTRMRFMAFGRVALAWTMTHEIGHTFGLPDEYAQLPGVPISPPPASASAPTITAPTATPTATYKAAPPQANSTVTLTPNRPSPRVPGSYIFDVLSIMGRSANETYQPHHFFWVAIEVKRLMAAAGTPANVTIV